MLRDRLNCGVNDFNIQQRLLQEPDLTFKKAYEIAKLMKSAAKNALNIRSFPPKAQIQKIVEQTPVRQCHRCGGRTNIAPCSNFEMQSAEYVAIKVT